MALTYSLKYQKLNAFHRVILEKEGEIIIDRQYIRLKGKGAQDQGEAIYFAEMKEVIQKNDSLTILTYGREQYVLLGFFNLFEAFLKDFWRVRNEYIADNLFMKVGMRIQEYECQAQILTNQEKIINKGKIKLNCYEGSLLLMPEIGECFVVYLDFLSSHEFDEEEYVLRLYLDTGSVITISKLGTSFEEAKEIIENIMGKMYQKVMTHVQELLPSFDVSTLLKLVYKIKSGRLISSLQVKKIDEELFPHFENIVFQNNEVIKGALQDLRKNFGNENFYLSFTFCPKPERRETVLKPWLLFSIPQKNILLVMFPTAEGPQAVYAFRIIMQQGDAKEKLKAKLLEIEQSLHIFRFDLAPLIKDKRELRRTKYRMSIRRLIFVRLLRKSYLGKIIMTSPDQLAAHIETFSAKAAMQYNIPTKSEPTPSLIS